MARAQVRQLREMHLVEIGLTVQGNEIFATMIHNG